MRKPDLLQGQATYDARFRLASAECRLPESLHFTECDVILGVVRARSVHKIGYGHNRDWPAAQPLVARGAEAGDRCGVVCAGLVGLVIVIGEGSVSVTPDYAQIGSGVTTRAKTVKEATEANSKLMAAIINALLESGVAQRDVQTSRFSIQPIYAPQEPRNEPKLAGYSVSNQVRLKIRQIHKVGEILDRLVTAGATDIGNVEFLVSEPSKALDQAREAAIADARRKAEVYARASGIKLGRVEWIA